MSSSDIQTKITYIKGWLGSGSINLFGLPFAGKDTHGKELARQLDGILIGGGDILRGSSAPKHVQDHIGTGALAPTEEYLRIVLPYFSQPAFLGKPLILSSVGRWHGEEAGVLEASAEAGHPLKVVLFLQITEPEMARRWKQANTRNERGHRQDNAEHILKKRILEYKTKTAPVISFYREQGMLFEIDAMPETKAVTMSIIDRLYSHATTSAMYPSRT